MSTSRGESQQPPSYGRKRSATLQSMLSASSPLSAAPLVVGSSASLVLWVHEPNTYPVDVVLNRQNWPGVEDKDMIRVTAASEEQTGLGNLEQDGFLFIFKRDESFRYIQNLQISVSKPIADALGLRHMQLVRLTKVDSSKMRADYIEIVFQDQYLGRSDMWRLGKQMQGRCAHIGQEVMFIGSPIGKIQNIYIGGKNVSAGLITAHTKTIYRSLSAKVTIFIQVCRELWEFAGDGERYNEKIVHSFLPELFRRWREAGTNHLVTIVLISRVFYEKDEIEYAAGPLMYDEDQRWYKDFYKVITDLEVVQDWKPTLVSLKESFVAFQRDILLTHHYHRAASLSNGDRSSDFSEIRLVGRISFAHDGPVLEAVNLALNPLEIHYVDRSLSLTGAAMIVVTPGTGYYRVPKRLLRMTTTRLLDQGFGLDIVSLAKPPLHETPIFSFKGLEPGTRPDMDSRSGWRTLDPLWGGDGKASESPEKVFWWEPFWIAMSFWDQQMDLPFRQDRFVARAKMHQIEMLGLLEHDVLSSITVPYLQDSVYPMQIPMDIPLPIDYYEQVKADADTFDLERFALSRNHSSLVGRDRDSGPSSGVTTVMDPSSYRSHDKRPSYVLQRASTLTSKIAPIEESPKVIYTELPPEGESVLSAASSTILSSSPTSSVNSEATVKTEDTRSGSLTDRESLSKLSRFTSSWLFNAFRTASQPTSSVSVAEISPATAVAVGNVSSSISGTNIAVPTPVPHRPASTVVPIATPHERTPRHMAIRNTPSRRSIFGQRSEDESAPSARNSYSRPSPLNVSPREEHTYVPRRPTLASLNIPLPSSSPSLRTNPLRTSSTMPYTQTALASRWQHSFPQPVYKHQIKWKNMVTPGCLPLTTEYFPTKSELESCYEMFLYDVVVEPSEMRSFLVKNPNTGHENVEQARQAWALAAMRVMASLRLVQGFQFVVRPSRQKEKGGKDRDNYKYFVVEDKRTPRPSGASDIFHSDVEPVFLSMNNEIHRISYNGEAIQVRRYVRRMPNTPPYMYKCLVWPKLGVGYTELSASFGLTGLENYGWNSLDMLIAGYESNFSESLRSWRTRFIVIPTLEPPASIQGPSGEKLNDEEVRLLGADRLAELFSRLRWAAPGDKSSPVPVRFIPTYLSPTASVVDEHLVAQLDEIQAVGPHAKKVDSEREIAHTPLAVLAKLMRDDPSLGMKDHKWHSNVYTDSFTGHDFVNWLVREFRDVSTREQGADWGGRLLTGGLFEHCRGAYQFIDGHYFYRLKGVYAVPRPQSSNRWFRSRHSSLEEGNSSSPSGFYPGTTPKAGALTTRRNRKRLVLSETMVADIDPLKKSDQAETVILHYDLIHNPANVFHFELTWLGTTARCIEEMLRQWSNKIERYGLRLVEAYITQIADIRERNPFQSCFPFKLAIPPPEVPELEKRLAVAEGTGPGMPTTTPVQFYFEYALLRHFGFILDIEAYGLYPESVDVFYSYRKSVFTRSQFVHRSGVAFVQVLGGSDGFLFLTNRLMGPGRMGQSLSNRARLPSVAAEELREKLTEFCNNPAELLAFYDQQISNLP